MRMAHFVIPLMLLMPLAFAQPGAADHGKDVVLFQTMPVPVIKEGAEVFQATMAELGYRPGEEIRYRVLEAEGDPERGRRLLSAALAEHRPDLVVAIATMASIITKEQLEGTGIPWLFFTVTDPVGAGLVTATETATGANFSGRVYGVARQTRLELAAQLVADRINRRPIRIGMIHSDYPSSVGDRRMVQESVADDPRFVLKAYEIPYQPVPEKLDAMLAQVAALVKKHDDEVDGWWSPTGPLGERDEYIRLLRSASKRPVIMATNLRGVESGALLYVGPDVAGQAREIAGLADRILRGEDAGTIPVTTPQVFTLGVNLETAERLGVILPSEILDLAGKHVYR